MKWLHLMIIVLVSVGTLSAATINVPEDAATIQAGMDMASNGDTVLVDRGTYVENINFNGNNVVVMSRRGPVLTIIDGNQNGAVVHFLSQEDESAVLDGFTITNGSGFDNGDEIVGGGIACRNGSSPTMKNLIVTDNAALGGDDPAGGGITIAEDSNPTLENIEISFNRSKWGGGLAIATNSNPTLHSVYIHYNRATTTGGGVYIGVNSSPYFKDVYVHLNRAAYYGGGIFLHENANPIFNKITVRDNTSPSGGGGLISNDGSSPMIINSIFKGNVPDQIMFNGDPQYDPDTLSIAYSNIQDGQAGITVNSGQLNWLDGNTSVDPCFIDVVRDDLQAISPCVDSGTANFSFAGVTWIDMEAAEYVGSAPDKGSHEVPPAPRVFNVPASFSTIQSAIDASVDGDIVRVNVGTYVENINFNGKDITVESVGGPELTTIDGNQNGSTVLIMSGESENAVLDGFTITNGTGMPGETSDVLGGGILIHYASSPTLKNLIVSGNSAVIGLEPDGAGGGIAVSVQSNPVLENIIIANNNSVWGGGLSIAHSSSPSVKGLKIYGNTVSQAGGGVYIGQMATPYFEDVYIHDNVGVAGGGLFLHDHARPTLNKITVEGNRGTNGGGGMLTNHASSPLIVNSIFYSNMPDQFYLMDFDGENLPDTVSIAYSNVQGGVAGMHPGIGQVNWITGNLQTNPRFGTGDHLGPSSPCIDAGTAQFEYEGATWIDMSEDEYVGSAPDMGSWEVPGPPQTLLVPSNYTTIQLAIDAALEGDTVLVADGTYIENINFLGKNIAVLSEHGPEVTIIDGGNTMTTVMIVSQEVTAVLDGFTITNGLGWVNTDGYSVGGGINVRHGSTPTLRNLIVEGNTAVGDTAMGGGIMCAYGADALIEDVVIRDNEADYGGGIVVYESSPTLRRVKISENYARTTGGGLTLWTSDALVEQVAVFKNHAYAMAGGVWIHLGGNPTLDRVTVADNRTSAPIWRAAGGIGLSSGANLTLINSIVWYNTHRGGVTNNIEFYESSNSSSLTIEYSDIQGGEAGIITNDNGTVVWETTNIVDNPLFVNRDVDDYNLETGSPCIGTGENGVDMGAGAECMIVDIDPELATVPQQFELYQNYPNPFNPSTSINFELPGAGWVTLVVYDVSGREVATLIEDQRLGGRHSMNWFARDKQGKPLGTGLYLYEMNFIDSGGKQFRDVRKFTLLK
ncbi:MAG: hypothetical protein H8E26_13710 [FCB group bacterium]|nr:hypothetical protein [FCB group bacterium]MBL7027047.1 hypothetical protein [Candidatus Neomarinimicrobiota bacterium]MBL7123035.1 hypothetical protein [Candidatus Neomarinimicrobiota bacterium]